MDRRRINFRRLRHSDHGGATAFGVMSLIVMAMVLGVALDATNLYQQKNLMQLAADAASHAGVVALAQGDSAAEAEKVAGEMVARNMPRVRFGRVLANRKYDLRALNFDPDSRVAYQVEPDDPANAVFVRVQRTQAVDNLIPTYVLRFFGIQGWAADATSAAAIQPTRRCANAAGLFARGRIQLSVASWLGADLCIHSQTAIAVPTLVQAEAGVRLSVPSRKGCEDLCQSKHHPELAKALVEMNLIMPTAAQHVTRIADGFVRPGMTLPEKAAFFATRPLSDDLEPLAEVGLDTSELVTGSVLTMSAFQFTQLRQVPAGLVYNVTCDMPANQVRPDSLDRIRLMGFARRATLRNMVLITSCPLDLDHLVSVEGALVILKHGAEAVLAADPGAGMGDPDKACDPARRSVLMTTGSLRLPADLSASNLAVVAGGDVILEANPGNIRVTHHGLALHAGGGIGMVGPQVFAACPGAADPLLPSLKVIGNVMLSDDPQVAPRRPGTPPPMPDGPGRVAERQHGRFPQDG